MCGLIYHFSKCQNYDLIVVIYLCKEKLMSARPLRAGMMSLFNATVCNFLQKLMKGIKQALSVAIIKASLLLRCGDVELNPGPLGEQHHCYTHYDRVVLELYETGSIEVRKQREYFQVMFFGSIAQMFIKSISFSCGGSKGGDPPYPPPIMKHCYGLI